MAGPESTPADLNFLQPNSLYKTQKPYRLQYEPEEEGLKRTNIELDFRHDVPIHNLRYQQDAIQFNKTGFELEHLQSKLSEDDFFEDDRVEDVYHKEVEELLMKKYSPQLVRIMEHSVRKRHKNHPISEGQDYTWFQPTTIVHSDYTPHSALEVCTDVLKVDVKRYKRIIAVNVWKPLHGPITDWPLALCDASTVTTEDFQPCDVVSRDGYTENCRLYFNPDARWCYFRGQVADEVVIFRQYDSDARFLPVAHTGFADASWEIKGRPRESVEIRAFMFFE